MQLNRSYIFFRFLKDGQNTAAHGVLGTPLKPLRSLAVDTEFNSLGLPIFVHAPELQVVSDTNQQHENRCQSGFNRLMFAHDVGSAIKGRHRGDIFFGSGESAGRMAGETKHKAELMALMPSKFAEAMAL